jgi:endonuclease YncB( thermonuclease family)
VAHVEVLVDRSRRCGRLGGAAAFRATLLAVLRAASVAVAITIAAALPAIADSPRVLHSYAIINPDATMIVRNRLVRLYGIFIPEDDQLCGRTLRPVYCGNRAAVALNFKVRQFVRCDVVETYDDGSVGAYCAVGAGRFDDGEDLGAYLISNGLALAAPGAPFQYQALERIAAVNGRGVWGFQVDAITRRRAN